MNTNILHRKCDTKSSVGSKMITKDGIKKLYTVRDVSCFSSVKEMRNVMCVSSMCVMNKLAWVYIANKWGNQMHHITTQDHIA